MVNRDRGGDDIPNEGNSHSLLIENMTQKENFRMYLDPAYRL